MKNRNNTGAAAIWEAVIINGFTDATIKCSPDSESIPDYVLSWVRQIVGSEYVDRSNVFRTGLAHA
jgi:hypothetical protein